MPHFYVTMCDKWSQEINIERCTEQCFYPFIIELFDLRSYDSESRKMHTKAVVDASKGKG